MKNILITGGAGYIGSHIAELLIKKKSNINILDNLSTGHKKLINKNGKFIKGDVKKPKYIKKSYQRRKYNFNYSLGCMSQC